MDSHEMEPATFREDQKKGYLYQDCLLYTSRCV